jgi:hypothetical protein
MTEPLDHSTRYDLMTTNQASPSEMAEWLKEPGFAAYVAERQGKVVPKAAPSDAALIERIAECMWQAEWKRGGNGGSRKVPWTEVADTDRARYRFVAREVAALATIPAAEPAVKPLEWRAGIAGSYTVIADTVLGQYSAWHIETNGFWRTPGGRFGKLCGSTLEAAKAAAQSDYEQRIRSALVDPQPARETEAARDVPPKPDGEDDQFFTLVFAGNIKDAPGNPFKLMTPYGLPGAVGVGHAFRQLDRAEAALRAGEQP